MPTLVNNTPGTRKEGNYREVTVYHGEKARRDSQDESFLALLAGGGLFRRSASGLVTGVLLLVSGLVLRGHLLPFALLLQLVPFNAGQLRHLGHGQSRLRETSAVLGQPEHVRRLAPLRRVRVLQRSKKITPKTSLELYRILYSIS